MTTATATLTEFLLARIAEDEEVANAAREHEYLSAARDASPLRWVRDHLGYGTIFANSGRVLAECEAKRRIVELHKAVYLSEADEDRYDSHWTVVGKREVLVLDDEPHPPNWCDTCQNIQPCATIRILAAVYSDHEDYRSEWRP